MTKATKAAKAKVRAYAYWLKIVPGRKSECCIASRNRIIFVSKRPGHKDRNGVLGFLQHHCTQLTSFFKSSVLAWHERGSRKIRHSHYVWEKIPRSKTRLLSKGGSDKLK